MSNKEEALKLGRYLAAAIDHGLKNHIRDPKDPPTNGQLAVMIIMAELEWLGFELVQRRSFGPNAQKRR